MSKRVEMVSAFYNQTNEDTRLERRRHGQLEYLTTMHYIHKYLQPGAKVLEIGAGTGRYSIALAKEGYAVTAVELVEHNLEVLRENGKGLSNLQSFQGDALHLERFPDDSFDVTLVLGPMYHLYDHAEVDQALEEAIRVTKPNGVILVAFLSVYAILFSNYLGEDIMGGLKENFTDSFTVKHFAEQLFTGYDIGEFEALFAGKAVSHVVTAAADSLLEFAEYRGNVTMTDAEFQAFAAYHLATCEKRELLGCSNHLLYICRKSK